MTTPSTDRLQHIAAMYAKHADQLRALVRRQAPGAQPATIEDACAHAWSTLIAASTSTCGRRAGVRWRT